MSKYKYILWDIDGTLIDFHAAEEVCIRTLLREQGVEITMEQFRTYQKINRGYWEALEKNEITKPEVYVNRFRDFFALLGVSHIDTAKFNADYQRGLAETVEMEKDAMEVLTTLSKTHKQYAVTNGSGVAQTGKLAKSGLDQIFEDVFISEVLGYEKPNIEFFEAMEKAIPGFDRKEAIIIGDSLTSDMRGGNNAGIINCWYNPRHLKNETDVRIDYEIDKLTDVYRILEL